MSAKACPICQKKKSKNEMLSGSTVRENLLPFIQKKKPDWTLDTEICLSCLNSARYDLLESYLLQDKGPLSESEQQVVNALRDHDIVTENPVEAGAESLSFGDRMADQIAKFGGSWLFIIVFFVVLIGWILLNTMALFKSSFDPYPFILLNLILSCVAAIQAPVIMMSQNRKDAKDRLRSELDYKTNLKAELEIRHLHIKVDQILSHQWQRLSEIQQVQLDLLKNMMEMKPQIKSKSGGL